MAKMDGEDRIDLAERGSERAMGEKAAQHRVRADTQLRQVVLLPKHESSEARNSRSTKPQKHVDGL